MKIYDDFPLWLGLYTGPPVTPGFELPGVPREPIVVWEKLPKPSYSYENTDTFRVHVRIASPPVTHGAIFAEQTSELPIENFTYQLPVPFPVVAGRDLAIRPGGLMVKFVLPNSTRPFGRGPFGVSQYSTWPEAGVALGIFRLVLDTLFEAVPLACGGQWPAITGEVSKHAP
jgi:hypothetical protein